MRTITIIGPSQAGKTELATALAGLSGDDGSGGRPTERLGITGLAEILCFDFMGEPWAVIDLAGGVENLASAGPALAASDAVLICLPADAEAALLAAPYLRLLETAGLPGFLFINGTDRAEGRLSEIVAALQPYAAHPIVLRQVPLREGGEIVGAVDLISERAWKYREGEPSALVRLPESDLPREQDARSGLLEMLADFDDHLLEQLIEDQAPETAEIYAVGARSLASGQTIPALIGSALHRNGIRRMMKALRHDAPRPEATAERLGAGAGAGAGAGRVVPLLGDMLQHLGKVAVIRTLGGPLASGARVGGDSLGGLTALDARQPRAELPPGAIGLAVKSDHVILGRAYDAESAHDLPEWLGWRPGTMQRIVAPASERDDARLSSALERCAQIDPGLRVGQDGESGQPLVTVQGPQHLARLLDKLTDGLGVAVETRPPSPPLREALKRAVETRHRHRKQSGGAGQFAEVQIRLNPLPRGSGFRFDAQVKGGTVPRNYYGAVEAGIGDALAEGPNGAAVIDLEALLLDGKTHSVDSSDYAFRTAARDAARQALADAGTTLLHPVAQVVIHIPSVLAGALAPVVAGLKGQVRGFAGDPGAPGWDVVEALMPMSALDELGQQLGGASRGTAWFDARFDSYQPAPRTRQPAAAAGR